MFSAKFFIQAVSLKYIIKNSEEILGGYDNFWLFCCSLFAFLWGGNSTLSGVSGGVGFGRAIINDFCCYTIPFVVCIHSTYVISGVLVKVNLSFGELYKVSKKSFFISLAFLLCLVGLVGYQFYELYWYSRLYWYIIAYGVASIGIYGFFCLARKYYELNLFPIYCLFLVPVTATPGVVSKVLQGSLLGLFIENTTRVGFRNMIKNIEV